MTITLQTLSMDHIIDFKSAQTNQVVIPSWINNSPSIMSAIWNKTKEALGYTVRLTDAELYSLIQLMITHTLLDFGDSEYYGITAKYAWVESWLAEYDGEINAIKPWKVELKIVTMNQS